MANITAWGKKAQAYLHERLLSDRSLGVVMLSEMHVPCSREQDVDTWCRARGLRAAVGLAKGTERGGTEGGVAVLTRASMGAADVHSTAEGVALGVQRQANWVASVVRLSGCTM
eukprot:11677171-Alexandrium_andersonii.AAC.1